MYVGDSAHEPGPLVCQFWAAGLDPDVCNSLHWKITPIEPELKLEPLCLHAGRVPEGSVENIELASLGGCMIRIFDGLYMYINGNFHFCKDAETD